MSSNQPIKVTGGEVETYINQLLMRQAQETLSNQKADRCINALIELAKSMGYTINAKPTISDDGRIVAYWGVVEQCQSQPEST